MTALVRSLAVPFVLLFASPAFAEDKPAPSKEAPAGKAKEKEEKKVEAKEEKCEHGVKKTICTRCNPKLEAVFKAKGDWCAEHTRPESQCALCHPELKKKGVK